MLEKLSGDSKTTHIELNHTLLQLIHKELLLYFAKRYNDHYYKESVAEILETISERVNKIARKHGLSQDGHGKELMTTVFSVSKPILNIVTPEDSTQQTKTSLQEGYMFLFAGAQAAFRNPSMHRALSFDSKVAIQIAMLASILMDELDKIELDHLISQPTTNKQGE